MPIVSDATPIIYLGKIGKLHILRQLYGEIYIPDSIWKELIKPLTEAWIEVPEDVPEILRAYSERWLMPRHLEEKFRQLSRELLAFGVHENQAEAIALTKQLKAELFLTNDEIARNIALKYGVKTKWLTEILLSALKAGLIKRSEDFDEILDQLVRKGLWIRKTLIQEAKRKAGTIES